MKEREVWINPRNGKAYIPESQMTPEEKARKKRRQAELDQSHHEDQLFTGKTQIGDGEAYFDWKDYHGVSRQIEGHDPQMPDDEDPIYFINSTTGKKTSRFKTPNIPGTLDCMIERQRLQSWGIGVPRIPDGYTYDKETDQVITIEEMHKRNLQRDEEQEKLKKEKIDKKSRRKLYLKLKKEFAKEK